jgi:hypothetical protein
VNLDKLAKQLRRDMAANPKKAAALGLMVLVALYFWGPLAWKFVSASSSKRTQKMSTASLILTDDPAEPTQQTRQRGGAKFRWEKVRQLIKQDPQMVSAAFDPIWIEPFGKPTASAAAAESVPESPMTEAAAVAAAVIAVDPSEIGIVLGGVMIGPRNRVATINGKACHEGDVIEVADKNDKSLSHEFRVVKIRRHGVELDFSGRMLTLELKRPTLSHGDEIEGIKLKGSK